MSAKLLILLLALPAPAKGTLCAWDGLRPDPVLLIDLLVNNYVGRGQVTLRLRGRPGVGAPPEVPPAVSGSVRGRLFQKPSVRGDPHMPAGTGGTDKYGNIVYSTAGSTKDRALALYHEKVHQVLSPKLSALRELRADIGAAAYDRSAFCRYLEEMLAEGHAQLRVNGLRGLPDAIRFPVANNYVTVSAVLKEAAIGTITVGGVTYGVYLAASEAAE